MIQDYPDCVGSLLSSQTFQGKTVVTCGKRQRPHHSRFRMRPCRAAESFRDHGHLFLLPPKPPGCGCERRAGALQSYFQAHPDKYAAVAVTATLPAWSPPLPCKESPGSSPVISETSNCPFLSFLFQIRTIKGGPPICVQISN
jgi:hypothetical protein